MKPNSPGPQPGEFSSVAGLVLKHFCPGKNLGAGGIYFRRALQTIRGPLGACPVGRARHGKAFEGLLQRYFG